MEIKQIATLMNEIYKEVTGQEGILLEDLSNVVDMGTNVMNANSNDRFVKALVDRIGRTIFVQRPYRGRYTSLKKDGWKFGAVLQKISMLEYPEADIREDVELENGASYDCQIFYGSKVEAKYFSKTVTAEVHLSIKSSYLTTDSAFASGEALMGFWSMIEDSIEKSLTIRLDETIARLVNNSIAETIFADYQGAGLNTKSGKRAINLLYLYNNTVNAGKEALTVDKALYNLEFLKFATKTISEYKDRLVCMSTIFNINGRQRFTPKDKQHLILLSNFDKAITSYLQADTYHKELVGLNGKYDVTPYWQGTGTEYDIKDCGRINITTGNGNSVDTGANAIVLGWLADDEHCMVCCENRRTTTAYNAKADFYNTYNKVDFKLFSDSSENALCFFIA